MMPVASQFRQATGGEPTALMRRTSRTPGPGIDQPRSTSHPAFWDAGRYLFVHAILDVRACAPHDIDMDFTQETGIRKAIDYAGGGDWWGQLSRPGSRGGFQDPEGM